jgi:hypothetical protein
MGLRVRGSSAMHNREKANDVDINTWLRSEFDMMSDVCLLYAHCPQNPIVWPQLKKLIE